MSFKLKAFVVFIFGYVSIFFTILRFCNDQEWFLFTSDVIRFKRLNVAFSCETKDRPAIWLTNGLNNRPINRQTCEMSASFHIYKFKNSERGEWKICQFCGSINCHFPRYISKNIPGNEILTFHGIFCDIPWVMK